MASSPFYEKAWKLCAKVPRGKVTTYRDIAHAMGTKAYRAVGQAMNKNPHKHTEVPCHRVVGSDGSLGGFAWDINLKIERLKKDGISVKDGKILDFKERLYRF